MKAIPRLALIGVLLNAMPVGMAKADDWGCEVLLCLVKPAGPADMKACVPPIKKLWRELSKGRPFPVCFMGGKDDSGTGAEHRYADRSFCPPNYLIPPRRKSDPWQCAMSGAVTVFVNGQPTQRVWWRGDGYGTVVEPVDAYGNSTIGSNEWPALPEKDEQ